MDYRYLDFLNNAAIGVLVVIILAFYVYLTLEGLRSGGADDRHG